MKAARCFRAMLCLLMGLGLCGCSDDEQPLPAYVQTLADLEVGNPASRQTLVLEDGELCGLLNMLSGVRPDTMLRVCVAYTAHPDEGGLRLHACEPVFSPMPKPMATLDSLCADPVKVVSVWKTQHRWVNLRVDIPMGGQAQHVCGFVQEWQADAQPKLRLTLYHDQCGDGQQYTTRTYMSIPIRHYADSLVADRDSLEVCVNTPSGWSRHRFAY